MCSIARGGGPGTAGGRPPWLRRKLLGRTRVRVGAGRGFLWIPLPRSAVLRPSGEVKDASRHKWGNGTDPLQWKVQGAKPAMGERRVHVDSKWRKGQVTCMRGEGDKARCCLASTGGNMHGCGMAMKE